MAALVAGSKAEAQRERHPADAGGDERPAAGRRPPEVVAGLKGHVRRRPPRRLPGRPQRVHLRVRLACLGVEPLPNDLRSCERAVLRRAP
jgi:hypothetical protein